MPSRRRFLLAAGLAGLAGAAGCMSEPGTDPTPTGDEPPTVESPTPTPGPSTGTDEPQGTAEPGTVAWRRTLSGDVGNVPALAGDALFAGTETGTVAALSRNDGSVRWRFGAGEPVRDAPVVAGDVVLAVSGNVGLGDHHAVHALDAATGEERWTFTPREWWLDVLGAAGDTAYVATHDDALAPGGQTLYALALPDGSVRWSVGVGDNSGGLVTDGAVYVPSYGVIDAVGIDGTRRWTYEFEEYQFATICVAGDTVAFGTGSSPEDWTVRGLDAATGEERWTFDDWVAYTTRAAGDRLFVGGEKVARLEPAGGEVRWEADQRAALYDAPVADGRLYVAGDAAAAIAVDDGTVAWRTDLDVHLAFPAGLADGHLLVQTSASREDRNRHVLALDHANGERAWEFAGEHSLTEPVAGDDRAYVAERGDVLALGV